MYLFYVDESGDEKLFILAALAIPASHWRTAFEQLRQFRLSLQQNEGIDLHAELHAWKFVSGRGNISERVVTKSERCRIFMDTLSMATTLPDASLITVSSPANQEEQAFTQLLTKIQDFVQVRDSHALIICDQGKEQSYTRYTHLLRTEGSINNILEEPFFKDSAMSYFIQISDFCAYALLRQEHPLASKTKYGLDQAFSLLGPLVQHATRRTQ